jgi:Cu2+-exporting ATPase
MIQMNNTKSIKKTFPVLEMTCAACAVSVESILKNTPGVINASVNYANASVIVEYDLNTNVEKLRDALRSIGYDILIDEEADNEILQEEHKQNNFNVLKVRTIWSIVLTIPVVIIGMFYMNMPYGNWISMILTAPVVFYFGRSYFINAIKQAKHRTANMDTLVALSTFIAFVFSVFNTLFPEFWHQRGLHAHVYFEAAAVVITFISLGKLLEENAKSNTSSAIKKLIGLQAKTVNVFEDNIEKTISIKDVKVNHIIIIKPGEKIPVDGYVIEGHSFVDESMISGEPVAIEKFKSEKVYSGTINQKGSFKFIAEKVGSDTILAQIINTVQQAQGSKAPVQKLVDKIASIFVPVVIGTSILTFFAWLIFGGENGFTYALLNSVTVLVIACPCALGLATPTAIMVGVGKGAENNILIKDAESLETAYKVDVVVLDKTGTITEGKPIVQEVIFTNHITEIDKQILLSIESLSEHPLANAIVEHLKLYTNSTSDVTKFISITGRGVQAIHNQKTYYVGNFELMNEKNILINNDFILKANELQALGNTVIWFSNSINLLAIYAISDKIKESSSAAIKTLQERGIEVFMLTGDNIITAKAVANRVGLKNYIANVLPSEKYDFIKKLQSEGRIVAMVGDGINDSQALAQADLSIAMGKGSDIAMDVAKITLITSDLQSVPKSLFLSKKIVMGVRQNLFWAFIYNIIGIPIAAGVLFPFNGFLLDTMIAGAAMALSSVSVVSNSLRLKTIKL